TLTGLSGLGDLILTCASAQSRNFSLGVAIGKGEPPGASGDKLAEGAFTASVLIDMAMEKHVDMPVSAAVAAVLDGKLSVDGAIEALVTRALKWGGAVGPRRITLGIVAVVVAGLRALVGWDFLQLGRKAPDPAPAAERANLIVVEKSARRLTLLRDGQVLKA